MKQGDPLRSVEGVFQALAWLEARQLGRSDLKGGAGLRVAPLTRGTLLHLEGAEANQGDALPLLEGAGDGGRESVQGSGRRGLRQVSRRGDGGDQFGFVHASVQVEVWPTSITSERNHKPDQRDQLSRVLRQPPETYLGVAELALDHPEGMLDFGPLLSFGLLDLANHTPKQSALAERFVGAAPRGNRPDNLAARVLGALFDTGIARVCTDI